MNINLNEYLNGREMFIRLTLSRILMMPPYVIGVLLFAIAFLVLGITLKFLKIRAASPLILTGIVLLIISCIWLSVLEIYGPGYLGIYANIIGFIILITSLSLSIIYFKRVRR